MTVMPPAAAVPGMLTVEVLLVLLELDGGLEVAAADRVVLMEDMVGSRQGGRGARGHRLEEETSWEVLMALEKGRDQKRKSIRHRCI